MFFTWVIVDWKKHGKEADAVSNARNLRLSHVFFLLRKVFSFVKSQTVSSTSLLSLSPPPRKDELNEQRELLQKSLDGSFRHHISVKGTIRAILFINFNNLPLTAASDANKKSETTSIGGKTIVELTPIILARYISLMKSARWRNGGHADVASRFLVKLASPISKKIVDNVSSRTIMFDTPQNPQFITLSC